MLVARQRSSWPLFGIAAVLIFIGVALRRQPVTLVAPSSSPGLCEWIAIDLARAAHALPIGAAVLRTNDVALAVGLACVFVLTRRARVSATPALSMVVAFALSASFDPALAPFHMLGFVAAAAAWLALSKSARDPSPRHGAIAGAALLATALITPSAVVWLSALAAWVMARSLVGFSRWRRAAIGAVTAAFVMSSVLALTHLVPRLPGSTEAMSWSSAWTATLDRLVAWTGTRDAAGALFGDAGPLVIALAALGAFSRRRAIVQPRWWPLWCFASVPLVCPGPAGGDEVRWLAPALVALWLVAATGLDEIVRGAGSSFKGRALVVLVVVLVPVIKIARPPRVVPAEWLPRGHARLSLDDMRRLVAALPDGAVLVRADTVADLLLRGLDGTWQRMGKSLRSESPRDAASLVAADDGRAPVFAMPAAQVQLQSLGLRLVDVDLAGTSAIARVRPGEPCTLLDATWRDLPALTTTASFSLVSQDRPWDGPVILYTEHTGRLDAGPHAWPGATARGFTATRYVRGVAGDRGRLDQAVANDQLPSSSRPDADDVVRFELWHPPEAPDILVIDMSDRPARVLARMGTSAGGQRVAVCPVFPHTPRAF